MNKEIARIFQILEENDLNEFIDCMIHNKLCFIKRNKENKWNIHKLLLNTHNQIDTDSINKLCHGQNVRISNCSKWQFDTHKVEEMTIGHFLKEKWKNSSNDRYYCKDWHLFKELPNLNLYELPEILKEDYLNNYSLNFPNGSDYRFVYLGEERTWTPLHHDVLASYSWSINLSGNKRWLFIIERGTLKNVKDVRSIMKCENEYSKYKNISYRLEFIELYQCLILDMIQPEDFFVFVPSRLYHQVHNLTDVLSVNHNWFNQYSIENVLNYIIDTYEKKIKPELKHLPSFPFKRLMEQELLSNLLAFDLIQIVDLISFNINHKFPNLRLPSEIKKSIKLKNLWEYQHFKLFEFWIRLSLLDSKQSNLELSKLINLITTKILLKDDYLIILIFYYFCQHHLWKDNTVELVTFHHELLEIHEKIDLNELRTFHKTYLERRTFF
ncbi:hypothetical protein SNEBB_007269 [Seison nebaliae]|nr:hypothetical protein SNEBB_007269 [Seison nebaliae]